jgi:hypothetical protein
MGLSDCAERARSSSLIIERRSKAVQNSGSSARRAAETTQLNLLRAQAWASENGPRVAGGSGRLLRMDPRASALQSHETEQLEQHLCGDLGRVGGRIVLRRDFDDIASDDIDAGEAAQDL